MAPVLGRRHFEGAPEGPVERRFRLVVHIGRDMAVPVLYYMAKRHERTEPLPITAPMKAVA